MVQSVMASSSNKDCEDGLDCFLVNLTGFTDAIPQEITSSSRSSQCDLHVLQNLLCWLNTIIVSLILNKKRCETKKLDKSDVLLVETHKH